MKIILASKSPRRRELLAQIGIEYECRVSEKEEKISGTKPEETVKELSRQKAEDVYAAVSDELQNEPVLVIGADTVVACGGEIMGKPKDKDDAVRMLKLLSGRCHSVWTGVTIICKRDAKTEDTVLETFAVETKVYMYDISDYEIEQYTAGGEPYDKAGAYAIQGAGAKFIEKIEGDYNNVVGLPVAALYQRLKSLAQFNQQFFLF